MNVWMAFLGSIVRWALTAIFGGLVVKGIIDEETLKGLTGEGAAQITAGILGLLIPLGWSFWQKIQAKVKVLVALKTPTSGTTETVEKRTGEIPMTDKMKAAMGDRKDLV